MPWIPDSLETRSKSPTSQNNRPIRPIDRYLGHTVPPPLFKKRLKVPNSTYDTYIQGSHKEAVHLTTMGHVHRRYAGSRRRLVTLPELRSSPGQSETLARVQKTPIGLSPRRSGGKRKSYTRKTKARPLDCAHKELYRCAQLRTATI